MSDPTDVTDRTQPALSRLALDLRQYRAELIAGFQSREALLRWAVGATGATLGRLPVTFLEAIHEAFITDAATTSTPPLLGGLLDEDGAVPNATAQQFRERTATRLYAPAASRAVRILREDAQEVTPGDDEQIDASAEQHAAMRPSLSQIERHQRHATDALLAGFDDVPALLDWGDVLDLATHGELPDDFLADIAASPTTRHLLVVDEATTYRAPRETIGAWLLRFYARGTRSRYRHAGEMSDAEGRDLSAPTW